MITDENSQDNRMQQGSDKSGTTSQVAKYYEDRKAGALSSEDTERCQTFFDKCTAAFPGTSRELAYSLCCPGEWLIKNRH
ncbi:TPA: hypothetical protein G8N56_004021 [Salmonella enterica]|uniref:hypothetical protein n=1 Tax=Citrobacter braakii TaxID=57706 RepID=UPI001177E25F|nr:hypothetical protein [Citrobacter braakii]QXC16732.1 hypothetical protein I6L51_01025 [Citrobacter braakii]HAF2162447.1 hypothetical protein [Salmonella enterica]